MPNKQPQKWPSLLLYSFVIIVPALFGELAEALGVNWGTQASHPLPPAMVVRMLKDNNIHKVKLFDANNAVLRALAHTGIEVMVAIPNDLLISMTDPDQANTWVSNNVVRYYFPGGTDIKYIAVGNEPFLKSYNGTYLAATYPALRNIQNALNEASLGEQIKATVPLNADILSTSSVPSSATFRPEISQYVMPILAFLAENNCPLTINMYPFLSLYNDVHFPVQYAFFDGTASPVIDHQYTYTNVFDASYDSLVVALESAGYDNMTIVIGEIGWPTDGDVNANTDYARKFNQGFINHMSSKVGTPRSPNKSIEFYLFSLIDEDLKTVLPGNFERHWGIFRYDGRPKYSLSLSGPHGPNLAQATGVTYLPQRWCVLIPNAVDESSLPASIDYACSNSDCTSLGYGCSCNPYLDANGNASYAFNQYYQMKDQQQGACYFNGLSQVVTQNPSKNKCEFMVQIAYTSAATNSCWRCTKALLSAFTIVIVFIFQGDSFSIPSSVKSPSQR